MDKNEYNLKLNEIDKLVDQRDYEQAAQIADQIDWKRVRNVRTLCLISEIYEAQDRYEDSKALLLRAYRRSPVGRSILYRLVEVTVKLGQFDEAIEYYSQYVQAAPNDTSKYILKYNIYRARGSSVEEQIQILKEYLDQEYNEKYAYELAKLYLEADRIQECIATCDDLVLWFHSGKYVIKALELKKRYAALTPKQQEIYNRRFEDAEEEIGQEKQIVGTSDEGLADTIMEDTQRAIAEEVARAAKEQDNVFSGAEETVSEPEPAQPETMPEDSDAGSMEDIREDSAVTAGEEAEQEDTASEEAAPEEAASEDDGLMEEIVPEDAVQVSDETDEEQPVVVDRILDEEPAPEVSYDPATLQEEVAKGVRELVAGVGLRGQVDEDELAEDEVIELSKEDQEKALAADTRIRMNRKLTMPALAKKRDAGQLTIDDVLLSMGEQGEAVREAVNKRKEEQQTAAMTGGVISAVDEALLNMGISPEPQQKEEKPLDQLFKREEPAGQADPEAEITADEDEDDDIKIAPPVAHNHEKVTLDELLTEDAIGDDEPDGNDEEAETAAQSERFDTEEIAEDAFFDGESNEEADSASASEEEAAEDSPEESRQDIGEAFDRLPRSSAPVPKVSQDMTVEDIMSARTRRLPTDEIAQAAEDLEEEQEEEYLDDDIRGLFDGYLEIGDLEKQIAQALEQALAKGNDRTSRTGNILIFGGHGCGKSTIATGLAKAIAKKRGSQYVKMARIYATDLNRKDIAATIAKIAGGILIVEEAGDLEDGIADQLTTAMEFRTDGLILILEDEQRYMHDLLMRHPRMTMKFTSQIYIPEFTMEQLAGFGVIYADERDYAIPGESFDALVKKIETQEAAQDTQMSITGVLEIVDTAITRADKFGRKLFSGKKRFDEEGRVILLPKDFR